MDPANDLGGPDDSRPNGNTGMMLRGRLKIVTQGLHEDRKAQDKSVVQKDM